MSKGSFSLSSKDLTLDSTDPQPQLQPGWVLCIFQRSKTNTDTKRYFKNP